MTFPNSLLKLCLRKLKEHSRLKPHRARLTLSGHDAEALFQRLLVAEQFVVEAVTCWPDWELSPLYKKWLATTGNK